MSLSLKIGIIGSRGIPNHYGGFEQCAEYLSVGLVKKGHMVSVYNSHNHPYHENTWNGVQIIHCFDPEYLLGTVGQFLYDLNCIWDAKKRKFDIILMLGYTSSSVWGRLYSRKSGIITNMDGLEWKRSKYAKPIQYFLKYAEKLAIKHSDFFIADSPVIQNYLQTKYNINSRYIAYGAELSSPRDEEILKSYNTLKRNYFLLMARIEPENNIEIILEGFYNSYSDKEFIVIGDVKNKFGKYLINRFKDDLRIKFIGAVFNKEKVCTLQYYCYLYFHGHSVGGTNPSLLEAMANKSLIAAHNNSFNKAVLNKDALYFSDSKDVRNIVETVQREEKEERMISNNLEKINSQFNWGKITEQYEQFICECYNHLKDEKYISNRR